jgi:hypothetical protein
METELDTEQKEKEFPVEYQIFALSLREKDAIVFFDAFLPEDIARPAAKPVRAPPMLNIRGSRILRKAASFGDCSAG